MKDPKKALCDLQSCSSQMQSALQPGSQGPVELLLPTDLPSAQPLLQYPPHGLLPVLLLRPYHQQALPCSSRSPCREVLERPIPSASDSSQKASRTLIRKHKEGSIKNSHRGFHPLLRPSLVFSPCLSEYGQDDWMMPSVAELMANGSSDPRDFWTRKSSHAQCNEDHQKGACGCS